MRVAILLAVLATPASSFSSPTQPQTNRAHSILARGAKLDCAAAQVQHALQDRKSPGFTKLGELPPGDLHLAVMREVDGCQEPVIVRHDIGGRPAAPAQPTRR
jgi:hypothetical protein